MRFVSADEDVLGPPLTSVSLVRDDSRRRQIWEASLSSVQVEEGVRGTFTSQVFIDLDELDSVSLPSYASRGVPLQTLARLRLEPEALPDPLAGVLRLERLFLDLLDIQPVIEIGVAVRAEMEDPARTFGDQAARDVAGGDDAIIGIVRHADGAHLGDDVAAAARRIGDEHDSQPRRPRPRQRRGRFGKMRLAIVHHSPHVAQQRRIAPRQRL